MQNKDNIIVGLDIGTTKICAVVGEVYENSVNIIGVGTHPSEGLRKGVVIDIEATVESIKKAIEDAELMAGCDISSVYVGIAGGHIVSMNSSGSVAIKGPEITARDIDHVIEVARAVAIPMEREVLHVVPQEFIVDGEHGITNPLGMSGVRLEADVHIVTGAVAAAQNLIKCANRAGLDVCDAVLESIASCEAVLTEEERKHGVVLLDLGGGTSDMAIFCNGNIKHTYVLTLGGNNLTSDISTVMHTSLQDAEKLKTKYGTCQPAIVSPDETIEVPSIGGRAPRRLPRQVLAEILEPRMDEIYSLCNKNLREKNMASLCTSGIVITGGAAMLDGVVEISERVFGMPARLGKPMGVKGLSDIVSNPMYSTGVGLVLYGARHGRRTGNKVTKTETKGGGGISIFEHFVERMKKWFKEII